MFTGFGCFFFHFRNDSIICISFFVSVLRFLHIDGARQLRRDIIAHGGISHADHESIPGKYKRKDGQPLDCIAQEMGYNSDNALMLDIDGAENQLRQLPIVNGKRVQFYRIKDFEYTAEVNLLDEHNLRTWKDEQGEDCPF